MCIEMLSLNIKKCDDGTPTSEWLYLYDNFRCLESNCLKQAATQ